MPKDHVIIGIDVGTSKVTTVIATARPDEYINIFGVAAVPAKGLKKGQIVDIKEATLAISESIEAAERMAGYSIGDAFVSVGGSHITSQNSHGIVAVADPDREITQEDVRRVIEAASAISLPSSREIIHILPRNFTVDAQEGIRDPIGMTGVRLEVDTHIITGSATAMRNLAKSVSEIGVDVKSLVFGGLASSEAVLTETEKELGVILVDIGGGTTDICLFIDGSLSYSAVLPIGARNITNDLAVGLRVNLESAEKIKNYLGKEVKDDLANEEERLTESDAVTKQRTISEREKKDKKEDTVDLTALELPEELKTISRKTVIEGIIKPRLNEIFTMIGLEVRKSGFGGLTPSGVVLSGGGAETVGIIEAARRILVMPVRIGVPTKMVGLIDEIKNPSFAATVGLVIFGAKSTLGIKRTIFINLPKIIEKIRIKGAIGKVIDFLKSFLP